MRNPAINVNSEIGKLKTVLLKRPGKEIENITPDSMKGLLFDDIPFLTIAQKEHDSFAATLKKNGVETLYIDELVAETLAQNSQIKEQFLECYLKEHDYKSGPIHDVLLEYLNSLDVKEMVAKLYSGIRRNEVDIEQSHAINDLFLLDPLPNAYFTRDPQASIGSGITINHMAFAARRPESLFTEFVIKYHPRFAGKVNIWRDRDQTSTIEGGDELVLNNHVLAVGISQRTSFKSIEGLAQELFSNKDSNFDHVLAIEIPHNHAMMHLDTVFTMINYEQFSVFPGIMDKAGAMNIFVLTPGENNEIKMEHHTDLGEALKRSLQLSELDLILTGNGDDIDGPREQWNDGSNTLAIAPGEVVTYDRNFVSNKILRQHGILVHEVKSSELSRGRGGPRCMSQPLWREDL